MAQFVEQKLSIPYVPDVQEGDLSGACRSSSSTPGGTFFNLNRSPIRARSLVFQKADEASRQGSSDWFGKGPRQSWANRFAWPTTMRREVEISVYAVRRVKAGRAARSKEPIAHQRRPPRNGGFISAKVGPSVSGVSRTEEEHAKPYLANPICRGAGRSERNAKHLSSCAKRARPSGRRVVRFFGRTRSTTRLCRDAPVARPAARGAIASPFARQAPRLFDRELNQWPFQPIDRE